MMNAKTQLQNIRSRRAGFTLVELMVVVVIIIVLVSIGVPVANKMRASSQRNQCMQQMRAWGVAIGGYAADHDGKVAWKNWAQISWDPAAASPYVHYWTGGSVNFEDRDHSGAFGNQLAMRHCPSVWYNKQDTSKNPSPTYAMIRPTSGTTIAAGDYPLAAIRNPTRFMMMTEALESTGTPIQGSGDFTTRVKPITQKGPTLRHNANVHTLLGDFSVRAMTWKDIEKGLGYWNIL